MVYAAALGDIKYRCSTSHVVCSGVYTSSGIACARVFNDRSIDIYHRPGIFIVIAANHLFSSSSNLDCRARAMGLWFVMDAIFIYLAVVNFQWGQRPWLHGVHWLNNGLLMLIIFLGFEPFAFPKAVLAYESMSVFWTGAIMIALVLAFSMYWQRLGRWAAFWSLLGVWAYALNWGQGQYALLWVSLATLFSLTIDSYAMAFIDELTGIPGRRAMEFKLKTIGKDYLLAMADVDHFKKFNDNHGHQVGDDVLKMVANVLSKTSKSNVYRYGGEEFVLVFSRSDSEDVYKYLDKTRESLEQYNLYPKSQKRERDKSGKDKRGKGSERKPLHITASFGLARQKGSEPYHYVISRADKALYKAKENGRNRIEVSK